MAKETVYNNTLVSGAADETVTYTRYIKDESSGKSAKELLDEKVNKTDQLGTTQIADNAVTTEKLENESVTTDKLNAASVTTSKLADSSVETEKLNDRSVTTEKVEEKAITNGKIGDSAVDGRTISEASVEKKHLANDSVSTEKLQDSAITSDKIHTDAVTEEKIKDSSVSNSKLANNSVGTSKIKDGNITNEKIANNTITQDKLDPELRKTIQAATGLPENLVEVIQDVDKEVKTLHSKDTDLQSQITDKQQQITAHDKDIELLQARSTQMEQTINNIAATGGASVANTVAYTNTTSGLESVNAQGAIDELAAKNKTQDATISAKAEKSDVQVAVSELKEKDSALSAELAKKFDKESISQDSGDAENKVMSQKAVSTKLSDISIQIGNVPFVRLSFTDNKVVDRYEYIDIDNPMNDNKSFRCYFGICQECDEFVINAKGAGTARTWLFLDSKGITISSSGYEQYEYFNYSLVAPYGAKYLVINDLKTNHNCYKVKALSRVIEDVINETNEKIVDISLQTDGFINSWSDIAIKTNQYINEYGSVLDSNYRILSDFILTKEGESITYSSINCNIGGDKVYAIACYDTEKRIMLGKGVIENTSNINGEYVIPKGARYIRLGDGVEANGKFKINILSDISEVFESLNKKVSDVQNKPFSLLKGKKIALFGDSIFEIAGSTSGERKRISEYLEEFSQATIMNFAFGGSSWYNSHSTSPNYRPFDADMLIPSVINKDFSEQDAVIGSHATTEPNWSAILGRLKNFDFSECDIVVLGYGTNDYANGVTIEQMKTSISIILEKIYTANPSIGVLIDLPHWRLWNNPDDYVDDAYSHKNSYDKTLSDYCDAISEISKKYGVEVNENLFNSGWNRYNMHKYFYKSDGVHFLSNACKQCARALFNKLNSQRYI